MSDWMTYGQARDTPIGSCRRRYIAFTLAAAAGLTGCGGMQEDYGAHEDRTVQQARYFQNRETGMCAVRMGDGNITTYSPVDCTPEILAKVYRP